MSLDIPTTHSQRSLHYGDIPHTVKLGVPHSIRSIYSTIISSSLSSSVFRTKVTHRLALRDVTTEPHTHTYRNTTSL